MGDEAKKPIGKTCNVNIGVLGHIDSGKTSLCRALSTVTSTASMDKHPQSQERGITLDLGFSAFSAEAPENFKEAGYESIQFCMVDCPGHASLIKTVIGGAQIIDLCMLVIDANKGIQAQTAECLVIAEILANQLVIVLNKVDMIPEAKRQKTMASIIKKLRQVFAATAFGADLPFAVVSACPGDGSAPIGVQDLVELLKSKLNLPKRDPSGPFMFSFDHAFPIKGQGTVLTGTVLSGSAKPAMPIVVPALGEAGRGKKIRSIQMFKQPVQEAIQGDRVAMCVAALDAKELERGIVIGEKFPLPTLDACICVVNRLTYFKTNVNTKAKFHVTLGHQTVMATAHFFCPLGGRASAALAKGDEASGGGGASGSSAKPQGPAGSLMLGCGSLVANTQQKWPTSFDMSRTYLHLDELFQHGAPIEYENSDGDTILISPGSQPGKLSWALNGMEKGDVLELKLDEANGRLTMQGGAPFAQTVDSRSAIRLQDRDRVGYLLKWMAQCCQVPGLEEAEEPLAFALLLLERPVQCPLGNLIIASKLDAETHTANCRMAYFGRILQPMDPKALTSLKMVKMKSKVGTMDRFEKQDATVIICKDMFKADTDMSLFTGLKVVHDQSGTEGILEGTFGMEGKFKVRFPCELSVKTDNKGNIKGETITLFFKKFDFMHNRKIIQ